MKKLMLLTMVIVFSASLVFAQGGVIQLTADQSGADCNLFDSAPGLLTFYAVHLYAPGVSASNFAAPTPSCMVGASYLSDTAIFPVTIGNSQNGVAIGYGACLGSPIAVLGINWFGAGLTLSCCDYPIVPDPANPAGVIEVVDCADNLLEATGGTSVVNPDPTCECDVPTRDATWGGIKALYAE